MPLVRVRRLTFKCQKTQREKIGKLHPNQCSRTKLCTTLKYIELLKYKVKVLRTELNTLRQSKTHIFQIHCAVQHESEEPLGLFCLFQPSTAETTIRYTTTFITFKYVVDKLEQSWATVHKEYCQNGGQKKPARKNPSREKTGQEIWVGSMAHTLKSSSYEGYTARRSLPNICKLVFQ